MTRPQALGGPFWKFWSAASAANLADGVRAAALPLLAAALTSDPFGVALVAAAQQGAALLLGLHAGVTADRYAPARVLMVTDWSRMAVMALLLAAVAIDRVGIPLLVACAFVLQPRKRLVVSGARLSRRGGPSVPARPPACRC